MSAGKTDEKRLRATLVLLVALVVEVAWLKYRVVPGFELLYRGLGAAVPQLTLWVFGSGPYVLALALAPAALVLALRGAAGHPRQGAAGLALAAVLVAGLGVGVIAALYLPL